MKILVINGPNINMLGIREPDIYGKADFAALERFIRTSADALGVEVELFQSNHEGAIVDRIQQAYGRMDGIVINPAAYTHTSVAILDASGDELAVVLDNSGVAPRGFLSVRRNDCVYLLEGDATASGACLDAMIADACADDNLRPDWYERADPPLGQMTWLLEEEWRARRGLPASES